MSGSVRVCEGSRARSSSSGTTSTPTTSPTSGARASARVPAPVPVSIARSSPAGATNERSCSRTSSICFSACCATSSAVAPKRARTSSRFAPCSAIDHGPARTQWSCLDAAHELVVNRSRDTRMRLCQDAVAEQNNRRPDGKLSIELNGERVHGDGADDAAQFSTDSDLRAGQIATEAVRVANWDDPDPGGLVREKTAAVARALSLLQELHLSK